MKRVEPKVYLVGETRIVEDGLAEFLSDLGVPEWITDAPTDIERLIEVMGKNCYKSFDPKLNPNLTRVRRENRAFINNIIATGHGSVIEHGVVNFIFHNVSRVFTHELVRHRAGAAVSQESLRFVRLESPALWAPTVIAENEEAMTIFSEVGDYLEGALARMTKALDFDAMADFHQKKVATSALRRILPDGIATTIGWSANMRTIRHVLEMRTDPAAEEEIRVVFGKVGEIVSDRYPHLFADYTVQVAEGHPHYKTEHRKV